MHTARQVPRERGRRTPTAHSRFGALIGAVTASVVIAGLVPMGAAFAQTITQPVPASEYALLGADSESPPYPSEGYLDGTAQGAFDGDFSSQWTVAYADGQSTTPLPHWIAFDTGTSRELSGLEYSVKAQNTGPVNGYEVYATNDDALADTPEADWGEPVAAGELEEPAANDDVQTIDFGAAVTARYVKFVATSVFNESGIASASELRVLEDVVDDGAPEQPEPETPTDAVELSNGKGLTVQAGSAFPQIVSYSLNGAELDGQAEMLDTFRINGDNYAATTTMSHTASAASYVSSFEKFPGLEIASSITVTERGSVEFSVDSITGDAEGDVDEISIPNHSLVSVTSAQDGANLARTRISTDSTTTADSFIDITADTKTDAKAVGSPYAFIGTDGLSAGILTNATDDSDQGNNDNWNTRLVTQIVDASNDVKRATVSVGNWTWAPRGVTDSRVDRFELPAATIVLADDRNGSGDVTWQDSAIAYRDVVEPRAGAERVPERVAMRIPFNFASEATNPFLQSLDNTKRVSMATDNLGQFVLEKGYGSEGHDSAHPDYAGHYNERAGGLDDFTTLLTEGSDYNADYFVHVNATEAYAGAQSFSDDLIAGQGLGWDWLNQSYGINQRNDIGTGAVLDRFQALADEAPELAGVYIDVYYSSGWLADALANQLNEMGIEVATEWAYKFLGNSVWSHWASDKNYGGATNKGINSNIARFLFNSDADIWNTDPVLGGAEIKDFEGWTGNDNWNTFYDTIWTENLPTKFLQHYDVTEWDFGKSASLTGGIDIAMDGDTRVVTMNGAEVLRGGDYLLPWQDVTSSEEAGSPSDADKMYFYSATGGEKTFTLTPQFADSTAFELYKLTDQGREKVSDVTAVNGNVTLTGEKGVPYVLAPSDVPAPHDDANYGAHTGLADPGFNSGSLDDWNPEGSAEISLTKKGDNVAVFGEDATSIAQRVSGLTPGETYRFGAEMEVQPGYSRTAGVTVTGDGLDEQNAFSISPAQNWVSADPKHGSNMQRATVTFTAPSDGTATVSIGAAQGAASITIDNARLQKDETLTWDETPVGEVPDAAGDNEVLYDFENNAPGWGPFVKGDAGGVTDARTSISELHAPYTQKEWKNSHAPFNKGDLDGQASDDVLSGLHSLKSHEENSGLVYRTIPSTQPFEEGHRYRVSFDYQSSVGGAWQWVTGVDNVGGGDVSATELRSTPIGAVHDTTTFSEEFVAGCGSTWVGLRKAGGGEGADFTLDNVRFTDLGAVEGGAACAVVDAPNGAFNAGLSNRYETSFTNKEATPVSNVAMSLGGVPDGWNVEVLKKDGNLFNEVAPGETVSTVWLITPPAPQEGVRAAAAAASADITVTADYVANCVEKSVEARATVAVAERPTIPNGMLSATADSENATSGAGEGPVSNVLDGDASTLWHTEYSPSTSDYPHWVQFDTGDVVSVDGVGYQTRGSGVNGNIADYVVSVSTDGDTWTDVATGTFEAITSMQQISFDAVQARYVKLTATSSQNGQPFAAAAEMRVYGTVGQSEQGYAPSARPASPDCTPIDPGPGGDGDGSGSSGGASDGDNAASDLPDRDLPRTGGEVPWGAIGIAALLLLGGAVTWTVGRRKAARR